MSRMFGDRIDEFVLSVDIMSEETFFDLLNLVSSYLQRRLGRLFAVLEEGRVDSRPGVTTRWSSADHRPAFSVDREAGYTSCSAFTFGENEPIWLVSPERKSLRQGVLFRTFGRIDRTCRATGRRAITSSTHRSCIPCVGRVKRSASSNSHAATTSSRRRQASMRWVVSPTRSRVPIACSTSPSRRRKTPIVRCVFSRHRSPPRAGHVWRSLRCSSPSPAAAIWRA